MQHNRENGSLLIDAGMETSRRAWRREQRRGPRRRVKLGKGAEAHRKRANELLRYAEYRKAHCGGIRNDAVWVGLFHQLRRAQRRAERPASFEGQREAALRATAEAWAFNLMYCIPPLDEASFQDATEIDPRWYFTRNTELAERLGITETEALATGAESLLPCNLWYERQRVKWEAAQRRRRERQARDARIAELIRRRWGNRQIADTVGVHRVTVWRHRKRLAGVQ